jgi:hypothetical protein
VVLEQIRIVGWNLWREALVVAVVLGAGTVMIVGEILTGGPGFDSYETFPTALISFLIPFAVWRGERRFGPSFLWTLPVERRQLALARVFAGWLWVIALLAFFLCWLLVLGLLADAPASHTVLRIPLTGTIAAYLFGSALVVGLRHPLRWLLGAAGLLFLLGMLGDVLAQPDDGEWRYVPGAGAFFSATGQVRAAFEALPDLAQWTLTTLLWFGAGLAVLWAAASRHREQR